MALLGLSPYTWIMIAFFILLVLVLVLGDIGGIDFDHDIDTDVDTGLSPMSLPIVAVFGASFGGYGTLLETVGFGPVLSPVLVPVLAMVFALLTAGGMYVVMLNVFVKTQAEARVDLESLKGFRGQVLVPIRPGQPGQIVVVTEARGRTLLQAIADEAIGTDEHVVVDSAVGNSVKVHKV